MRQIALSPEQMETLVGLGLDTSDASMFYYRNYRRDNSGIWDGYVPGPHSFEAHKPMLNHADECLPAYTLEDVLRNLPDSIPEPEYDGYKEGSAGLHMKKTSIWHESRHLDDRKVVVYSGDLLESAYKMLLWCIKNGHVETTSLEEHATF